MKLLLLAASAAWEACPYFTEILPDPQVVEDSRGEFAEILLSEFTGQDTLSVWNEKKKVWSGILPDTAKRLLLIRDTTLCPRAKGLVCETLIGSALPNSRKSEWTLLKGLCADTARLPLPKVGKSFVRIDSSFDAWTFSEPSPGLPNVAFEKGVSDCHLRIDTLIYAQTGWRGSWTLLNCDSARIMVQVFPMNSLSNSEWTETLYRGIRSTFETHIFADAFRFLVSLPTDDVPGNDSLDTLIAKPGAFPIRLTEVHPCPDEGVPEWVEIYNTSLRDVSLLGFSLCREKSTFPADVFLKKRESAVLTKDTASLRNFVGNVDVRIFPVNFGYLKNAADSLFLCYGNAKVDSVIWGKNARIQTHCPAGFSTASGRNENSPGFQTPGSLSVDTALPFAVEWNARLFSRKRASNPLMVRVQCESSVTVELISGKGDLLWKNELPADPSGNRWSEIPLLQKGFPGPNFLRFSSGNHEKRVGVILRP